ncbi:MAG TPA: glycosyltransferase family 4 protein [Solirubrobacterales bacterium]|nr:glycosyltransferase family 4 protein [Solirubrobacterales bacterium]
MSKELRLLVLDEGVLGGRTLMRQLRAALPAQPGVVVTFVTIPPPTRLERLLLRRVGFLGDLDLFSLRWRLRWSWQARRVLRTHAGRVDAAFVNTQSSALLARGPMRRTPCVLSVDATARQYAELAYEGELDRFSILQTRILTALERRAVDGSARTMAWSGWAAEGLRREGVAAARIVVLHPGLDAAWWAAAGRERKPQPVGTPLRLLFVGNDIERKGLLDLIAAVEDLRGAVELDVVTGDQVAGSALVCVHHGISGGTPELAAMYAGADALALPSRADASPWVVLEALAARLPVLATRVGAIVEMVGDAGILVEPGDGAALRAGLRELTDPARRAAMAAAAAARVAAYDGAAQTGRLVELLRTVAGEHRLS